MIERNNEIKFKDNFVTMLGNKVAVGDKAPDFTVLATDLSPVKLSDYAGKTIILSVMPSVDTGICAMQTTRFNKEAAALGENVQILTLSCDLPFALGRFCSAEGIENARTLSDHRDLDFGLKYGFAIKELRLLARGIIVIDKAGIITYAEYCPQVAEHPKYEEALQAVKKSL